MGSLFSGVGLTTGIDYSSLVDQLMAIEARPRDLLVSRTQTLDTQKAAFLDLVGRLTSLRGRMQTLARTATFQTATATSSLPDVLSATVREGAAAGSYSFVVRSLATSHQLVSRGLTSPSAALGTGTLTIESAKARANRATSLDELNGYGGVRRGRIELTNRAGARATVDLSDALTVNDVLDRINAAGVSITATLEGEAIVLRDGSAGAGTFAVRDVDDGATAADLGFAGASATDADGDGRLDGRDLVYLSNQTPLDALNDGLGLRRAAGGRDFRVEYGDESDFDVDLSDILKPDTRLERLNHGSGVNLGRVRITSRDGSIREVDLSGKRTVGDVLLAFQGAFEDSRIAVTLNGSRLVISDRTTSTSTSAALKIEDISGTAARDLGIAGTAAASDSPINGREILSVRTIADVLAAINYASGNADSAGNRLVTAGLSADGRGLTLTPATAGVSLQVGQYDDVNSRALADLGLDGASADSGGALEGGRLLGGINTTLLRTLNGGRGFVGGTIEIQADGATFQVDLQGKQTLRDVVDAINAAGGAAGVRAALDRNGTRLELRNADGGTRTIAVRDLSGTFAADAGLAGSGATLRSADLERRYVNENTLLSALNGGQGIAQGGLKITDSTGRSRTIEINGAVKTVQDLLDRINVDGFGVEARINDTGDGLLLTDTGGGTLALKVEETGSTTARDLNLLGQTTSGRIDGTYELRVDVSAGDTVSDVVARLNGGSRLVSATLINDGTAAAPYRLSLASRASGLAGELLIDAGALGLDFTTLTRPQDARVLVGGDGGVLVTSSSNTLNDVLPGITLNLNSSDARTVNVTVARNKETLLTAIRGMVADFNGVVDRMKALGGYNAETEQAGPLLGDSTLRTLESRLYRLMTRGAGEYGGTINRPSQLGLTLDRDAKLVLDETKLTQALERDPDAVTRFFTDAERGFGVFVGAEIEKLTQTQGLLRRRTDALDTQKTLLTNRIEDLNDLLDRKRQRLTARFQAMESALTQLQGQQAALSNFQWSPTTTSSSR